MIPVKTDDCNHEFYVDPRDRTNGGRMDCRIEVFKGRGSSVTSFWVVEHDDDLSGAEGIYVEYTHMHPETELGLGRSLEEAEMTGYPFIVEDRAQTGMQLTDEVREYLAGGGRFILRTFAVPPPPVMVWLA